MQIPDELLATVTDQEFKRIERIADTLRFTADQPLARDPHPSLSHFPPKHQTGIHWIIHAGTDLFKNAEPSALTHAFQTWEFSRTLAEISKTYEDMYTLTLGALLHDIGKILIPLSILGKPGRLTNDERIVVQKHALFGALIVERLGPFFSRASSVVFMHHEEWGGGGYPQRLSRDETPIEARIVHLADVVSALSCDRVYRKKLPSEEVKAVVVRMQADRQVFDPHLIEYLDHIL